MNRQIYEEASLWLVELRVGDIDAAARGKLDVWFRASPDHIRAFLELSSIWETSADPDLDRAHSTDELIARARARAPNVVALESPPAQTGAVETAAEPKDPSGAAPERVRGPSTALRSKRLRWAGLAASVAFLGGLLIVVYGSRTPTYATGTGEQRTVKLPDGSAIELNARSRIRVTYSRAERDVELLAGQALFKVAKDASRPFIVLSDSTRVRAVGTQFDVYRKSSGTTVTVVEGRVAILPVASASPDGSAKGASTAGSQTSSAPAILLSAGEQVTVTSSHIDKLAHADVSAATAWTQRELIFDSTPLTEVAQEFNRYNAKPLIVSDARLADFHVTGVFSSTNPAPLLKFLSAQKDIVVEETDVAIRITRK